MGDQPNTVGELLGSLTGRGVYDVAIVEEQMARFGFTYNRATDMLKYGRGSVRLHAGTAEEVARSMADDVKGGVLEEGLSRRDRLVDAVSLSSAVFKLLHPGQIVPSSTFYGRDKGFKADVAAIQAAEGLSN